ncbi:MAG: FHA domain-containing protein [Burkholderiaceae bacterium]
MSIKSWVLGRLHGLEGVAGRSDLPPRSDREPGLGAPAAGPSATVSEPALAEHLGAYAALIGAIRDELEAFVAGQVRLHLAIAERDRYLLTAIGVRCPDAPGARALLEQFMREFRPEQIKRYLAREVIAALPNAAAIDLAQFAGLYDADARLATVDPVEGEYAELLAALLSTPVHAAPRPYEVLVVGRWSEADPARSGAPIARDHGGHSVIGGALATGGPGAATTPTTPLAGQRWEFDIEDADGRRRVVLQSVVAGRRYGVGKGEGCDLRVNGTFTSRRHAEVWREQDAWWVADAGSTNGVRIESPALPGDRAGTPACAAAVEQPARLPDGARIVLSARTEGPAGDYPWLALRSATVLTARITPIAALPVGLAAAAPPPLAPAAPRTPLTAVHPAPEPGAVYKITAFQAGGVHTLELRPSALPISLGRSRSQSLVIDRRHEGVSGHHLDITEIGDDGVQVQVHGDNGVLVDGVPHPCDAALRWRVGASMVLGACATDHPTCTLTLTRRVPE